MARSGYINLLQVQDRKSPAAGDAPAATAARTRLLAGGVGMDAVVRMADVARRLLPVAGGAVAELGCGTGELLGALTQLSPITGIGLDLSTHALTQAARTWPTVTWVVANADRRLPLRDEALDLVLSLNARRNPQECARVLKPGGHLVIGLPAAADLQELREAVLGAAVTRERWEAVVDDHATPFRMVERTTVTTRFDLTGQPLQDLLLATYRGARHGAASQVQRLAVLPVTVSTDVLLFSRV